MAKRKTRALNQKENQMSDEQPQAPVVEAAQNLRSFMPPTLVPAAPPAPEAATGTSASATPTDEQDMSGIPPESIPDPESVFRLAMLDERLARIKMERALKSNLFEVRVAQLQEERKNVMKQLGREESETTSELERVRAIISQKHRIDLSLYAYDDATGTLKFIPATP